MYSKGGRFFFFSFLQDIIFTASNLACPFGLYFILARKSLLEDQRNVLQCALIFQVDDTQGRIISYLYG